MLQFANSAVVLTVDTSDISGIYICIYIYSPLNNYVVVKFPSLRFQSLLAQHKGSSVSCF